METRELFWGLTSFGTIIFYLIGFSAIGAFLWGVTRSIAKYRRGQPSPVKLDWTAGIKRMASDLLSHRTLRRRDPVAGAAHAAIFFGFLVLFIGTAIITLEYDILNPLFGVTFWKGTFFLIFSLTLDLAGLAVAAGVITMMIRRATFKLAKLDYRRTYAGETELREVGRQWKVEDWVFLVALLVIILTGFVQEGLRHALEQPSWGAWEPVGNALGTLFLGLGLTPEGVASIRSANWWLHGIAALSFIVALPWYKAKHMIAAMGSLATRDPLALKRLPKPAPDAATVGVSKMSDFSWKDMLDFDACTKCGRCHEACPARAAGYPLSPRDLILDLRLHNQKTQGKEDPSVRLIGDVIDPETLWSCRTCGACLEICPVGIEHPVKIVQMRRQLIESDQLDPLLRTMLNTIGTSGNSFGEPARKRAAWTRELEFKIKDIRHDQAETLWFVGDQASFDPRNQKVSRTVARLLKAGGVDFGLLYEGEKTAGNDVRRIGEEGLFESLVDHNLEQMKAAKPFQRIVTTDPHSLNTLHNEYPEYGELAPVFHYTELLQDLLERGALKVTKPLGLRVTYHDPCHLGRLNKRYDAPRRVLELIGCELIEMPRNRDNSFCCGAGGGRIWIPDRPGTQKPSQMRVQEAAELGGIDVFVTSCPKDLTMFEDARKTAGYEKDFVVEDIADLVAKAIELDAIDLRDLPNLTEKITAAIAERVATAVADRLDALLSSRGAMPIPTPLPTHFPTPLPTQSAAPAGLSSDAPPHAPAAPITPVAAPNAPITATPAWQATPVSAAKLSPYELAPREGVRILVPVKQIGKLGDEFKFASDQRSIPAEYFEYQFNEWDDTALEQALRTIESLGSGEVVVVTVGPPEAEDTLRKALAKGAHRGIRVWNDALSDADPVAVARLLAGVAEQEKPDLIITGAQSGDQSNGATGTALARLLKLPCAALVVETEWNGKDAMTVTRELEGGLRHKVRIETPALVTMQTGANVPRYATMRMVKLAKSKPIVEITVEENEAAYRAAHTNRMFVPPATRAEMLEGNASEVAAKVIKIIQEKMGAKA